MGAVSPGPGPGVIRQVDSDLGFRSQIKEVMEVWPLICFAFETKEALEFWVLGWVVCL